MPMNVQVSVVVVVVLSGGEGRSGVDDFWFLRVQIREFKFKLKKNINNIAHLCLSNYFLLTSRARPLDLKEKRERETRNV